MKTNLKRYILIFTVAIIVSLLVTSVVEFNVKTGQIILKTKKINKKHLAAVEYDGKKYSGLVFVAGPGEKLKIHKGKITVDGKVFNNKYFRSLYVVLSKDQDTNSPIEVINLAKHQADLLKNSTIINEVVDSPFMSDPNIYPYNPGLAWNKDNFGPIIIPHKNMVLQLNKYSFALYKPIIEKWEHDTIIYKKGKFFDTKGNSLEYYKFKNDYYFFINRYKAYPVDCRTWGPLPLKQIIGISYFVKSYD